jgi:stage III sporulation protein SpoIIIAA
VKLLTLLARRMMVPNLVLIEGVQNHTPDVIICKEIGRVEEVEAMQTVKERGVRCIASAHGNLSGLLASKQLHGLIRGVETVTVGDGKAFKDQNRLGGQFSKVVC